MRFTSCCGAETGNIDAAVEYQCRDCDAEICTSCAGFYEADGDYEDGRMIDRSLALCVGCVETRRRLRTAIEKVENRRLNLLQPMLTTVLAGTGELIYDTPERPNRCGVRYACFYPTDTAMLQITLHFNPFYYVKERTFDLGVMWDRVRKAGNWR